MEKILEAAQRASAITGGVLGLARPRADRREPTDLVRLAEEVMLLVGKDLSRNRVSSTSSPKADRTPGSIPRRSSRCS